MSEKRILTEEEQKKLTEEELENPTGGVTVMAESGNGITINSGDTAQFKPVKVGGTAGPQIMTAPQGANPVGVPWLAVPGMTIGKDIHDTDTFYFDPDKGDK